MPFSDAPMGRQLALSEGMLAGLAVTNAPTLRWYIPRETALVLGNGQQPTVVDYAACQKRGVTVYRRTSGGTAVLVDGNLLSLDLALPNTHPTLATSDVVRAYRWMGEAWIDALRRLVISDVRALPTGDVRAIPPLAADDPLRLACYGTLSPWEGVTNEVPPRKVVGLCQVRRRPGALYQVGVTLRLDASALGELLALPDDTARSIFATRLSHAAAGLDEIGGRAYTATEMIAAFEATLIEILGAHLISTDWLPAELDAADTIQRERFQPLVGADTEER
ncbi:MAG: hypothetical protein ABI068_14400 [Ktedonobacterales bacterium]